MEWSTEPVIEDVLSIIQDYDIDCTLFSTHDDGLSVGGHERALHPNFLVQKPESEVLDDIASKYPQAIGLRSHSLYAHSQLRSLYSKHDIVYESNYMMYRENGISPFTMPDGTLQLPIYFMDDVFLRHTAGDVSIMPRNLLTEIGLKVLVFHPTHICYNTPSIDFYENNKQEYYNADTNIEDLRAEGYGVREVFIDILNWIDKQNNDTKTMSSVVSANEERQ